VAAGFNHFVRFYHRRIWPGYTRGEVTHHPWSPAQCAWQRSGMLAVTTGYGASMTEMAGPERSRPVDLEGVPAEEGISTADAAERKDEEPDEQSNREDPVWSEGED
jgi:hypothetical protein